MKYRDLARNQMCMVRLPGICNHNPETVVLAHYRLAGTCGTGIKPPDLLGAWSCSDCHDAIDHRSAPTMTHHERTLAHAEGVMRTLYALIKQGKIK